MLWADRNGVSSKKAFLRVLRASVALLAPFVLWLRCGPLAPELLDLEPHVSTEVVDRHGQPLYETLSARGGRSRLMDPESLPESLVSATLAAEDKRFFSHPGVDPLAILRAGWHNLRAGRLVEGGSTLTQQTIKVLTNRPRSASGKLHEAVQALRLEHRLGKRGILALYLSVAPYGGPLVGAEAASRAYFGAAAANLTTAQAAFLAGLPQRPSALNPYRNPGAALARQREVLRRMRASGRLGEPELRAALAERLRFVRGNAAFAAPHFVERVLDQTGGRPARRLETTLDVVLQREVRGILEMHRQRLESHGAHNVAVAVLDNASGDWLAWEGSGDWSAGAHGGAIDGVVSPRQPGSALKPFTYALAFERRFTPASVLPDIPAHFATATPGVLYSPRNYDGVFRGPLRAREALAGSENIPAVWLLSQVGVPDLLRLLRRAGLTTLGRTADHYGYALTMGDAEVRLDELVAAYAAFARGGLMQSPRKLRRVVWADGTTEQLPAAPAQQIFSERVAFWVASILSDREARAYAFGAGGSLEFPFPVAVKTGTSQAYRDNWTVGFTRQVTVGVWVGNFDRAELRSSSGVTGAAPIFHDVLLAAERRVFGRLPGPADPPLAVAPAGLEPRAVCALSGQPAWGACPSVRSEWLPAERKTTECLWHRREGARTRVAWPAQYRAWARARGQLTPSAMRSDPARAASSVEAEHERVLRIVNPPDGALYLRDPTLRDAFQTLPLRAVASEPAALLTWAVDGRPLGSARSERPLDWPLAIDERGRTDSTTIRVK